MEEPSTAERLAALQARRPGRVKPPNPPTTHHGAHDASFERAASPRHAAPTDPTVPTARSTEFDWDPSFNRDPSFNWDPSNNRTGFDSVPPVDRPTFIDNAPPVDATQVQARPVLALASKATAPGSGDQRSPAWARVGLGWSPARYVAAGASAVSFASMVVAMGPLFETAVSTEAGVSDLEGGAVVPAAPSVTVEVNALVAPGADPAQPSADLVPAGVDSAGLPIPAAPAGTPSETGPITAPVADPAPGGSVATATPAQGSAPATVPSSTAAGGGAPASTAPPATAAPAAPAATAAPQATTAPPATAAPQVTAAPTTAAPTTAPPTTAAPTTTAPPKSEGSG